MPAAGRRRVTSRAELERVAFDLFGRQGFERTTVDDIAAAAGIGRRTFFRYFPSKNDVPWGDFEGELDRMRLRLKDSPAATPLIVSSSSRSSASRSAGSTPSPRSAVRARSCR